jgi:hypothetical protein
MRNVAALLLVAGGCLDEDCTDQSGQAIYCVGLLPRL